MAIQKRVCFDLSLSLNEVKDALAQTQYQLVSLSAGATVLGSGLIFFALARRFRRPMGDMLRGIRRVANGELDHRIPARVKDEFGELAVSFNKTVVPSTWKVSLRKERFSV